MNEAKVGLRERIIGQEVFPQDKGRWIIQCMARPNVLIIKVPFLKGQVARHRLPVPVHIKIGGPV